LAVSDQRTVALDAVVAELAGLADYTELSEESS
jgi:hypothetical protein